MMRRLLAIALTLSAWVAGTIVGSIGTPAPAGAVPVFVVGRAHAESFPAFDTDEPVFVLVLGSDSRPGTPVNRGLADSIHILGINPSANRATLYGIPRDSYVPLSTGGTNKINAAMPQGGPEAMIATVESLTGITFDYYVLTGFTGFQKAVNQIGGLEIDVPYSFQGYRQVFEAGPQTLDGPSALEYGRTRKSLPHGDFDRSMNQGRLMVASLAQFRGDFAKDPAAVFEWLGAGLRNVETTLSIDELTGLAFLADVLKPARVTNLVAFGGTGTVGGMSVVQLDPGNQALWQDLAKDGFILQKAIPAEYQPSGA
ncbi:MAG TPA: LCP family protein [Actinomycetota bacterium]